MGDFWAAGCRDSAAAKILMMALKDPHHEGMHGPNAWLESTLQDWHEAYGNRGLAVLGVLVGGTMEQAAELFGWEGATYPISADLIFSTGMFFPGPTVGLPAFIFVALPRMEIVFIQEGFTGSEEAIFEPYLD